MSKPTRQELWEFTTLMERGLRTATKWELSEPLQMREWVSSSKLCSLRSVKRPQRLTLSWAHSAEAARTIWTGCWCKLWRMQKKKQDLCKRKVQVLLSQLLQQPKQQQLLLLLSQLHQQKLLLHLLLQLLKFKYLWEMMTMMTTMKKTKKKTKPNNIELFKLIF